MKNEPGCRCCYRHSMLAPQTPTDLLLLLLRLVAFGYDDGRRFLRRLLLLLCLPRLWHHGRGRGGAPLSLARHWQCLCVWGCAWLRKDCRIFVCIG